MRSYRNTGKVNSISILVTIPDESECPEKLLHAAAALSPAFWALQAMLLIFQYPENLN
jgi:hypothetical protein